MFPSLESYISTTVSIAISSSFALLLLTNTIYLLITILLSHIPPRAVFTWFHRSPTIITVVHHTATDLLDATEVQLRQYPKAANTILPAALKSRLRENVLPFSTFTDRVSAHGGIEQLASASLKGPIPPSFWLSVWTIDLTTHTPKLDYVASCTQSGIDKALPIFIVPCHPPSDDVEPFITPRLTSLVTTFASLIPRTRVFAIYAPTSITRIFESLWSAKTSAVPIATPYYAACLTTVTKETLTSDEDTEARMQAQGRRSPERICRQATLTDIPEVADHCLAFARDSDTYPFEHSDALLEAALYVKAKQMYLCQVEDQDGTRKIACIVAVTRNTETYAFVTKVYTPPEFRGQAHAEVLVRHVCREYLFAKEYEAVSLYVAHENSGANKAYDRVGFVGLRGNDRPIDVVDYLEIGFEDAEKGFW